MQGWIKLHRKLIENPIMRKPDLLQLFIYCLLKANHEPGRAFWGKDEIEINRGQFVTGRFELANAVNQKPDTTYKRLNKLVELGYLNTKSNNKNTIVTIVNYDVYQADIENSNNECNNKITTKSQQSNTNKNDKNDKNDKKKDIYLSVQHLSISKEDYDKLVTSYGQQSVDNKIEYARNYKNLKKYVSLYLTLNNWLKTDREKEVKPIESPRTNQSGNTAVSIFRQNRSKFVSNG